ncbi:MAG: hypothetical protein O4752_00715 [Trichodesmium sp. St4_bin8_1]|nr:hypothetical protein [Trichodesmium sp. St4_bin8_1]
MTPKYPNYWKLSFNRERKPNPPKANKAKVKLGSGTDTDDDAKPRMTESRSL